MICNRQHLPCAASGFDLARLVALGNKMRSDRRGGLIGREKSHKIESAAATRERVRGLMPPHRSGQLL